jgi:cyclohexanone monooxygenase
VTYDVVIVGAGFAGLYMLHQVREYSYQFDEDLQQEWHWSERYSAQPEILEYLDHVADRFDLRADIQLATRVVAATYDEAAAAWRVETDAGDSVTTQFLVMATGCLSAANVPEIPGRDAFAGDVLHTGQWPHEPVDFTGKRVAVVGTGSSAIQSIPVIAEQAAEVVVFQRTASWSLPSNNAALPAEDELAIKAEYADFRARNARMIAATGADYEVFPTPVLETDPAERERAFEVGWAKGGFNFIRTFPDLMLTTEANDVAAEFLRSKIRSIVRDPETAELLSPRIAVGCKRMCIDSGYYETFNLPHVRLVDVSVTPIEEITVRGLRAAGREHEVDVIVFATGFDAMTGSLLRVEIRGRDGHSLRDAWSAGPVTYLGLGVAGFPNLFMVSGPGSPSVLTNMVVSIEQHVNWIADCIEHLRVHALRCIEARADAQEAWVEHVNAVAAATLFRVDGCNSWYLGSNIAGKPRVFMPLIGFPQYVKKCDAVAANGYEGFMLDGRPG